MNPSFNITKPLLWFGAFLALCLTSSVWANEGAHEAHAEKAAPSLAHDNSEPGKGRTYVVRSGDTLDRVIQKAMHNSPLKIEFLRDAVVRANPEVFTRPGSYRIRSGQVLQLPEMGKVLQEAVGPLLQSAEAHGPNDEQTRGRWVHFP